MTELGVALVATRLGVFLLRTILRFLKRKAVRNIESSEKLLDIKEAGMDFFKTTKGDVKEIPVVEFRIAVEKRIYLELQLQKLLLELTCDYIPIKTIFWERSYNIDGVRVFPEIKAPDIEAIGNGTITIKHPCTVLHSHNMRKWELNGKITYHSKIGDITKEKTLRFQLSDEKEEKLKEAIKRFHKFYVKGGYEPVS